MRPWPLAAWSAGLTAGGVALLFLFRAVAGALGVRETPLLRALLPRSARARAGFVGLSLAAGAGEELAYRGYAITQLAGGLGGIGAAVLTSSIFGVMHAYQGVLGIVRTAALGGLLAWGFLASGSLWPPIVAHAAIDVLAGAVLAEHLVVPEEETGVGKEDGTPEARP
jgi:membrane protease YdiL (CAAX protease family)